MAAIARWSEDARLDRGGMMHPREAGRRESQDGERTEDGRDDREGGRDHVRLMEDAGGS